MLAYQWHKDKDENDSGSNQNTSAEQSSKSIDDVFQCISGHNDNSQHNIGHVDSSCYVFGIIETFDFYFTNWKGNK